MFRKTSKIIAVILIICMVFTTGGTAFAASTTAGEPAENAFTYVSLGASQTNGYGMRGYLDEEAYLNPDTFDKESANVYGYKKTPAAAYPTMIASHLEQETGKNVDLRQLAMSGMRAEEVRVLLDENYEGDDYTKWRYTDGYDWFGLAGGTDVMRAEYKDAIMNADLITLEIGVNNFGTYPMSQILSGGKMFDDDLSDIADPVVTETYDFIKGMIAQLMSGKMGVDDAFVELMADTLTYAYVGYTTNFDAIVGKILEMNPDAELVVLGIPNILEGVEVTVNGIDVPLGDLFGQIVDLGNLYTSTNSPYREQYLFAPNRGADTFLDEIAEYNGDPKTLSTDMKDCFDLYDDELRIYSNVKKAFGGDTTSREYKAALSDAYDVVATVCKVGADLKKIDLAAMLSGESAAAEERIMKYIDDNVNEAITAAKAGREFDFIFDESILEDKAAVTALSMGVISNLGDTFFVHPNTAGHMEVFETVVDTLEHGTTSQESATKEINALMNDIMEFALEMSPVMFDSQKQIVSKLKAAVNDLDNYVKTEQDKYESSIRPVFADNGMNTVLDNVDSNLYAVRKEIKTLKKNVAALSAAVNTQNLTDIKKSANTVDAQVVKIDKTSAKLESAVKAAAKKAGQLGYDGSQLRSVAAEMYLYITLAHSTADKMINDSAKVTYALDEDSCYVALGDGSTTYRLVTSSYPRKLAKALGLTNNVGFFAEGEAGMRVDDLLYILDENYIPDEYSTSVFGAPDSDKLRAERERKIDRIESADLITVGFSNNTLLEIAYKQMMSAFAGKDTYEIDWSRYLDETGVAEVESIMAEVEKMLVEATAGMSTSAFDLKNIDKAGRAAIESYLYCYLGFCANFQLAIDKIHEINPDAEIILVGQFNSLGTTNLIMGEELVPVGEYMRSLTDLANLQQSGYAILTGKASYVPAPEVETADTVYGGDMDVVSFVSKMILKGLDSLDAGSAGHTYIKDQILAAMNIVDPATEAAMDQLTGLYDLLDITTDGLDTAEQQIAEARSAFDALDAEQKADVDADLVELLEFYEDDFEYVKAFAVSNSSVTGLKAKLPTKTKMTASWSGVAGAEKYIVKIYRNGKLFKTVNTNKKTVSLTGIVRGCTYKVTVAPVASVNGTAFAGVVKSASVVSKLDKANITAKKKGTKATVKSKDQNSTGFQVWVSTNKNFKKNVTKKIFKTNNGALNKTVALKKGTNYIKVRAYTTINGKTVYGAWSNSKVIKR